MNVLREREIIERAEHCYRVLLVLYPEQFRHEFQQEMLQAFRESCRATLRQQGESALPHFWASIVYDLLITVSIEHYQACILKLKQMFGRKKEFSMLSPFFQLNVAARTDIGCVRANNEDSMLSIVPEDRQLLQQKGALFIVADGMGGHNHGEIASQMVVEALREAYYQNHDSDLGESLRQSIIQANNSLLEEIAQMAESSQMGTTCIAAVLHGQALYIANVGDSRAYVIRKGTIRQISQDHSFVAEEVRKGNITEEEARVHPKRSVIFRSLGYQAQIEVDLFTEQVEEGDALLMCTDGLSQLILANELLTAVGSYEPEESVEHLIALAKERGAPDNVTALIVRVGGI